MKRRFSFALAPALVCLWLIGCAPMHVFSHRVGNPDFSKIKTFYVIHNKDDTGMLNKVIAGELVKMGYAATTGTAGKVPDDVDALVTYDFQWFWDMGNYLLMLRIHLRNPETNFPYAMGESLRTSLARKPPEAMVREILEPIFNPATKSET